MKQKTFEFNVHAQNQLREVFNYFIEDLTGTMQQFLGMKVAIADRTKLSKRFHDAIESVLDHQETNVSVKPYTEDGCVSIQILRLSADMWLRISLCFSGGKCEDNTYYCYYVDESYYMGNTDREGYLEKIEPMKKMELVDLEIEKTNLMKAQDLKEQFEKVNSKLLPDNRLKL